MQAEGPIRHFGRRPDDLRILSRHLGRVVLAPSQKVKVKHAADDVIFERRAVLGAIISADLHIHARRTQQKDAVRATAAAAMGTFRAMLKVHRVIPVQVRAARDAKRVAGPERARRVDRVEAERLRVLAEAVDVGRGGQGSLEAEVLRLKDERVARGREEHLARARARDVERERRRGVREFYLRRVRAYVWLRCRTR